MSEILLKLKGIGKDYPVKGNGIWAPKKRLEALDQIHLEVMRGETLGLVGESGCGKSTLAKIACCLEPPSRGEMYFSGEELQRIPKEELRKKRHLFQPVFQDPFGSLNPRINVSAVLAETLRLSGKPFQPENVLECLARVGLGPEVKFRFPHQLSGGQRQRLGIARALAAEPQLLVADEPVSSLDVSIQAQILNLLLELQAQLGLTMLFISHDLRVISHMADSVAVMYLGRIMERAAVAEFFSSPKHPYAWALLEALPKLEPGRNRKRSWLSGERPSPIEPGPGCRFYSRCPYRESACLRYENQPLAVSPGHEVACWRWQEIKQEIRP